MFKIPMVIAKFLAVPETRGFSIHDKFAYLIKSMDGDNYYLCEQLPSDGFITEELGSSVYEVITKSVNYEDIFNLYKEWCSIK